MPPDSRQRCFFCNGQSIERYLTVQSAGNKRLGTQSCLGLKRTPALTLLPSKQRMQCMRGGKNVKSGEWEGVAKCSVSDMLWLSPSLSNSLFSWIRLLKIKTNHSKYSNYTVHPPDSLFCATVTRSSYSSVTDVKVSFDQSPQFLFPPKNWLFRLMMQACWQQISKDEDFWNIHSAYTGPSCTKKRKP